MEGRAGRSGSFAHTHGRICLPATGDNRSHLQPDNFLFKFLPFTATNSISCAIGTAAFRFLLRRMLSDGRVKCGINVFAGKRARAYPCAPPSPPLAARSL